VIKCIKLRLADHVARMEEDSSAFKIVTGKPKEEKPLGRPRRRWERISKKLYRYEEFD